MSRRHIFLVNTGSPDAPTTAAVARYLHRFLTDPNVMPMPAIARRMLVDLCIVPMRARTAARRYRSIWTAEGSPLAVHSRRLAAKVSALLPCGFEAHTAMLYGRPSLADAVGSARLGPDDTAIVVPMFPQSSPATTAAVAAAARRIIAPLCGRMIFAGPFFDDPAFVSAWVGLMRRCRPEAADAVVFSFHGLPVSMLDRHHPGHNHRSPAPESLDAASAGCYRAQCYRTAGLIADDLGLNAGRWTVAFQSRLSDRWCRPFVADEVRRLADAGCRRLLIATPAFVADCLETLHELAVELPQTMGGRCHIRVCPCLNDDDAWASALTAIALRAAGEDV